MATTTKISQRRSPDAAKRSSMAEDEAEDMRGLYPSHGRWRLQAARSQRPVTLFSRATQIRRSGGTPSETQSRSVIWNWSGPARVTPICAAGKASLASRQRAQSWMICAVGAAESCKYGRNDAAGLRSPVKSEGSLVRCSLSAAHREGKIAA